TLMNKGLEVIEAHELFGIPYERIEVVVHPQSIVHSMVETSDGATLAQLSLPDMRLPIGYALSYPDRLGTPLPALHSTTTSQARHTAAVPSRVPALQAGLPSGRGGGSRPCMSDRRQSSRVKRLP